MAKLVKDLPVDPYEYLVQLIHDKKQVCDRNNFPKAIHVFWQNKLM